MQRRIVRCGAVVQESRQPVFVRTVRSGRKVRLSGRQDVERRGQMRNVQFRRRLRGQRSLLQSENGSGGVYGFDVSDGAIRRKPQMQFVRGSDNGVSSLHIENELHDVPRQIPKSREQRGTVRDEDVSRGAVSERRRRKLLSVFQRLHEMHGTVELPVLSSSVQLGFRRILRTEDMPARHLSEHVGRTMLRLPVDVFGLFDRNEHGRNQRVHGVRQRL